MGDDFAGADAAAFGRWAGPLSVPALDWLVRHGAASADAGALLAEFGRRLVADGLPLAGGSLSAARLHPLVARSAFLWRSDTGEMLEAFQFHGGLGGLEVDPAQDWWATLGATSVTAMAVAAGDGSDHRIAWATAQPSGFPAAARERLEVAAVLMGAPLQAILARGVALALLEAYLGRRSAGRVLAGALARGGGETIRAVLIMADLRGFTRLSEALAADQVIAALDAWFERLIAAINAFGGEVLKLIGDGLLAIVPIGPRGPAAACTAALNAVRAARAGMAVLDEERVAAGLPPLPFGVALHLGEVVWGNIGAADRLDFTAIGPAVNFASRLEGLCKTLRPVLASNAFAEACPQPLAPLGEHRLRDVAAPCAVFTLPELADG